MKLSVTSETGLLKAVIVHTPGREVSLVNPELKDELLFDDIIFEEDARREHLDMLKIFETVMPAGGRIFEITELFEESLHNSEARSFFIDLLIDALPQHNLGIIKDDLQQLTPGELLQFVIEGVAPEIPHFSLAPTPNLLFTRDLAAVAGHNILLSKPAKQARLREALLMEMLIKYHPLFKDLKPNLIKTGKDQSIEGGDILVASEKVALIGMGERTSFSALISVSETLLSREFEHVVAVDIPKKRSSMHLDTIFTFASENECLIFPPAFDEHSGSISVLSKNNGEVHSSSHSSIKNVLQELLGRKIAFIKCGGESVTNQFREQWTDGANVFALAPGFIVGYGRNKNTFQALKDHGYQIMNQFDFINAYGDEGFVPGEQKMAISFAGHELCRGRGGARCMTMPILREKL